MTNSPQAVGIDIGGTHLRAALIDADGGVCHVVRQNLVGRDPQALVALIDQALAALVQHDPRTRQLPMGLGLAAQLWVKTGVVAVAPNLGWRNVPFGSMLAARFGPAVRMVNDLNAIAVGEAWCGAGAGCSDLACVFVGTGVGMGAVVDDAVVEGADGLATELGHIKVADPATGRLCGCGERGCIEAYASGRHLPDLLADKVRAGLKSRLHAAAGDNPTALSAGAIDAAAGEGDPAAQALWDDIARLLGCAIGNAITLFNPRVLVLGGGVLGAAPSLREAIARRLKDYAARPAQTNLRIVDTALGDDAGIVGAAHLAMRAKAR